jgi:carbon-monoxide dehydrogenase medium subunit
VTPFTYLEPPTLEEVLHILAENPDDAKVIAGGTSLVNFMKAKLVQPRLVVGLRRLKSLATIATDEETQIGALATLHAIEMSPVIAQHVSLLGQACHHVATIRVRTMATLGGAVAHADPALDTPPALIAVDARIKVSSQRGTREIPVHLFFTGIFETMLQPDELVTQIIVPPQPEGSGPAFIKFTPATHDDYPTVSVASRVTVRDGVIVDARIGLGAVGTTPVRAEAAERSLIGMSANESTFREAAELTARTLEPLADFRGSSEYKRNMAAVHVRRALTAAAGRAVELASKS